MPQNNQSTPNDTTHSKLTIRVFDGSRQELDPSVKPLITIRDGNQQVRVRENFSSGTTFNVPFYNNFGDRYTVLAAADGYEQAGYTPVCCTPDVPQQLDLMLLKKDAGFNFREAKWETLKESSPAVFALLSNGVSDDAGKSRYDDLIENGPDTLACFFNLTTAMAAIQLPAKTPLDYFKQVIWGRTMASDRFFAYADSALYDQVKLAAHQGAFEREAGFEIFHKGATDSYKQVQFGEANVQLTFHADDTKDVDGVRCVMMEPDIDYYKDPLNHGLLEVVRNKISNGLTDPRQVYVLRWIAGRHAGVPEFNPPYVIV